MHVCMQPAEPASMFIEMHECRVAWTRKRKRASCLDFLAGAALGKAGFVGRAAG